MSNQLTPMQEAIDKLDKLIDECQEQIDCFDKQRKEVSSLCSQSMQQGYKNSRNILLDLLPKEQQVIEDAVTDTLKYLYIDGNIPNGMKSIGKDYYNTKFK